MLINIVIAILGLLGFIAVSFGPVITAYQSGKSKREKELLRFAIEAPQDFDLWITKARKSHMERQIQDYQKETTELTQSLQQTA